MSSPISNTLGKDALRVALNINRREVLRGQQVELEPMWCLFRDQGLDLVHVAIAFQRFKKLEGKLGVQVVMPATIHEVPAHSVTEGHFVPPPLSREIDEILGLVERPRAPTLQPVPQAVQDEASGGVQWKPKKKPLAEKQRLIIGGSVFGVLLAALVVTTLFGGPASVDAKSFAGTIPIEKAWRVDNQVEAQLATTAWLSQPLSHRNAEMRRALAVLKKSGVDSLILMDASLNVRGVISRAPNGLEELYFK